MKAKFDNSSSIFDKLFRDIPTADLSPEVNAEFVRLQKQSNYLRSDAYWLRLELLSLALGTIIVIGIVVGINYAMASAGVNPAKLHKVLYSSLGMAALFFLGYLWKIWRKQSA